MFYCLQNSIFSLNMTYKAMKHLPLVVFPQPVTTKPKGSSSLEYKQAGYILSLNEIFPSTSNRAISLCFDEGLYSGYDLMFFIEKSCGSLSSNLVIPIRTLFGTNCFRFVMQ